MDLASCFQSVSDGKSLVAAAITDRGTQTAADATFNVMANNIRNLYTPTIMLSNLFMGVGAVSYTITCPKKLSNGLIAINWGGSVSCHIRISNYSFSKAGTPDGVNASYSGNNIVISTPSSKIWNISYCVYG
jgi:hypothetical protein